MGDEGGEGALEAAKKSSTDRLGSLTGEGYGPRRDLECRSFAWSQVEFTISSPAPLTSPAGVMSTENPLLHTPAALRFQCRGHS